MDIWTNALNEFHANPVQVFGALLAILGALSAAFKTGRRFWSNLWARLRSRPIVPTETFRVVQDVKGSFWSPSARVRDVPAMQVSFHGHVTDISGRPNRILRAEIAEPQTEASMVLLSNGHDGRRPQVLGAHESAELHASFFVQPIVGQEGKPWKSSVIFVDQYGNRHKLKNAVFHPIESNKPSAPKEPEEFPYAIQDPIEKQVVSVLKAEIARYRICGRRVGGLGSVFLEYRDQQYTRGWPADSWTSDSALNQVLIPDTENASIHSDNVDALVNLYEGIETNDSRIAFVNIMLKRLAENAGYLEVSYFIVAVLWRVGAFTQALRKARQSLPQNEQRVYGLSNVLMLLNGLLRYRHVDFSSEMLDEIERMLEGLDEHPFLIPTRIAAIRTERLRGAARHKE